MNWETDGSTGVGNTASDGLTDPPGCVGRELETLAPVELLDSVHKAKVAFLNEVEKRKTRGLILLRDRDNETEVGLHEGALCIVALFDRTFQFAFASNSEGLGGVHFGASGNTALDGLRQTNFVVLREQGVLANVSEIETNEILFVAFNTFLCHCHTSGLRPGESTMGVAGVCQRYRAGQAPQPSGSRIAEKESSDPENVGDSGLGDGQLRPDLFSC